MESASVNRVEVDRSALRHNLRLCAQRSGNTAVLAMIKADAYGHGMLECAQVFVEAGAAAFGVAEPVEGIRLRRAGFDLPILVMAGYLTEASREMVRNRLTPVLVNSELVPVFAEYGTAQGEPVDVYLKVDVGMGRQGCLPEEALGIIGQVEKMPGIRLAGIMAHFPMADQAAGKSSPQIIANFDKLLERGGCKEKTGCATTLANSGGIFNFGTSCFDLIRPGIALYGYYADGAEGRARAQGEQLKPAMRFSSRVLQVREVPSGTGLGYGYIYTTARPTRLAVLPVGYEDGYLRILSNRAQVLIRGQRAPVVGRISMNLTLVDVTGVDGVQSGDEVVLLGRQGAQEITADEIAGWMESISYEVLCLFGNLNDRYYI
jgi:alanine racemase